MIQHTMIHWLLLFQLAGAMTDETVLLRLTPAQQAVHATLRATASDVAQNTLPNTLPNNAQNRAPNNLEKVPPPVLHSAQSSLQLAKRSGDSRYASRALALLQSLPATTDRLLLQAEAAQYLHQFTAATEALSQVLKREPNNADAHLLAANLAFTRGDARTARQHCLALLGQRSHLLSHSCLAYAESLHGQLASAQRVLAPLLSNASTSSLSANNTDDASERSWALELLADMAERGGDDLGAEQHYRAALTANPDAVSARAALADLLLRQQRPTEVRTLLRDFRNNDVLLLRDLQAARFLSLIDSRSEQALAARFAALQQRGDRGHEREQALHAWWLLDDPQQAFSAAKINFRQQRETVDIRLYAQLALLHADATTIAELQQWMQQTGYQDAQLTAPLAELLTEPPGRPHFGAK